MDCEFCDLADGACTLPARMMDNFLAVEYNFQEILRIFKKILRNPARFSN